MTQQPRQIIKHTGLYFYRYDDHLFLIRPFKFNSDLRGAKPGWVFSKKKGINLTVPVFASPSANCSPFAAPKGDLINIQLMLRYVQQRRKPRKYWVEVAGGWKKIEATMMRVKVLLRGGQGWPMAQIEATGSGSFQGSREVGLRMGIEKKPHERWSKDLQTKDLRAATSV